MMPPVRALRVATLLLAVTACDGDSRAAPPVAGIGPSAVREIRVRARSSLVEGSAAVMSRSQPGVLFTINDSGHGADLYALDAAGADRGMWRITNAINVDWEAASMGPCGAPADAASTTTACVYIGDVGDNDAQRGWVSIYRVPEPVAAGPAFTGALTAERLRVRYPDGAHDVEAMYASASGDVTLITKRRRVGAGGTLQRALVFSVPASAWGRDSVVAMLVDSLPIVPGSRRLRTITDAALSPDGWLVAVRTYGEVYVFATDSTTGRIDASVPPTTCNIEDLERGYGEGIDWLGARPDSRGERGGDRDLILTHEGRNASMFVVRCPVPQAGSAHTPLAPSRPAPGNP